MSERRFPIMPGPSVPWRLVEPYARQIYDNHEQTLERLAERGGLDPTELWCAVHSKRLREAPINADDWLRTWLDEDIEQRTAERIAAWLDTKPLHDGFATAENNRPYNNATDSIARRIRTGAWRGK